MPEGLIHLLAKRPPGQVFTDVLDLPTICIWDHAPLELADQLLTPTYTADLAHSLIAAVDCDARGLLHVTNSGACSWHEFTLAIMETAGIDVPVEPVATVRPPGGADRPLNGVLSFRRALELGLPAVRPWRDALEDYMTRAGLAAEAAVR